MSISLRFMLNVLFVCLFALYELSPHVFRFVIAGGPITEDEGNLNVQNPSGGQPFMTKL